MRKCFFLFMLCVSLLCFFTLTSCSTTEVQAPDISNIVDPVLMQRPDNSQLRIKNGPILELQDVVHNSAQYMMAWELWENYADSLEKTLTVVRDELKNP